MKLFVLYQLFTFSLCFSQVFSEIKCFGCMGGPLTDCAVVPVDAVSDCKTSCYEAYIEYQNGAMQILQRGCWAPPNNTKANSFCDWFPKSKIPENANADMKTCKSCVSDRCNGSPDLGKSALSIPRHCS